MPGSFVGMVKDAGRLPGGQLKVFFILAALTKGGQIFVPVKRVYDMSDEIGLGYTTMKRHLHDLALDGWVERVGRTVNLAAKGIIPGTKQPKNGRFNDDKQPKNGRFDFEEPPKNGRKQPNNGRFRGNHYKEGVITDQIADEKQRVRARMKCSKCGKQAPCLYGAGKNAVCPECYSNIGEETCRKTAS